MTNYKSSTKMDLEKNSHGLSRRSFLKYGAVSLFPLVSIGGVEASNRVIKNVSGRGLIDYIDDFFMPTSFEDRNRRIIPTNFTHVLPSDIASKIDESCTDFGLEKAIAQNPEHFNNDGYPLVKLPDEGAYDCAIACRRISQILKDNDTELKRAMPDYDGFRTCLGVDEKGIFNLHFWTELIFDDLSGRKSYLPIDMNPPYRNSEKNPMHLLYEFDPVIKDEPFDLRLIAPYLACRSGEELGAYVPDIGTDCNVFTGMSGVLSTHDDHFIYSATIVAHDETIKPVFVDWKVKSDLDGDFMISDSKCFTRDVSYGWCKTGISDVKKYQDPEPFMQTVHMAYMADSALVNTVVRRCQEYKNI
jgi:hypothetical protein